MLGKLFRRERREPERIDPWEALVGASAPAADEADQLIGRAVRRVAPELGYSVEEVVLNVRRGEQAFETVLSEIEGVLEELCGRYDYRQLLFVSRLCSGLPWLRSTEKPEEARMRTLTAACVSIDPLLCEVDWEFLRYSRIIAPSSGAQPFRTPL